ncbi:MAG: chloride channel protein [Deltaproteobacteria bacterium]|nr:chloride channel protein [Deltaproteobacteria bacterium]
MPDPVLKQGKKRHGTIYFLLFSVAIGVISAAGALVFRTLIELFQTAFWPPGTTFLGQTLAASPWLTILIPALGGLVAGIFIYRWVPEAKGPGVPEVIAAVATRQSIIRHRVTFLKALITSLLIGSGASVGREGPIVQIGASAGSSIAQLFRLDPDMRRVCLASGAAAGIAATFNAPITGTLFALEIILLDIEVAYISHIIVAAVIASVLSRFFWGNFPTFEAQAFHLNHYGELIIFLFLGLLAGIAGITFLRLLSGITRTFDRLKTPEWIKPGLGGLLLGIIALWCPNVLGVGYETVNEALANSLGLKIALVLLIVKMLATALCIGSGMSGGIFAPSLFWGASLGLAVGIVAEQLFPALAIAPGNFALVGMGAVVAGTTLAPITAILTIFELTNNYETILPLMVACIASTLVVRTLYGYSAYEMKLLHQGINLVRGHDVGVLQHLHVRDFMSVEFEAIRTFTPLSEIAVRMEQAVFPHFIVLNEKDELTGVLSLRDLKGTFPDYEDLRDVIVAADLMSKDVISIAQKDTLEKALYLFEEYRFSLIPVTQSTDQRAVVGVLIKDDLLRAYREQVLKDRVLSSMIQRPG